MRGRRTALVALVAGLCTWAPASAGAVSIGPPGGFRLPASSGYSIHAIFADGERFGRPDSVVLSVSRKGAGATYFVVKGAQVSSDAVTASLGDLGSIDLHFVPTGGTQSERSACSSEPIEFDAGYYEGRFDFEGEEGFTVAHATRVPGEVRTLASLLCGSGGDEGVGGHAPGARLLVRRHWSNGNLALEVIKNSPTRPSRFNATIDETRGALGIEREVDATSGPSAFDFNITALTATVAPPAPFRGRGRFVALRHRPGILRGTLAVDFPGRSNVPLRASSGSLVRWVQNPAHPFRATVRPNLFAWLSTKLSPAASATSFPPDPS